MDLDDLEEKASAGTAKVLLLSHMRSKVQYSNYNTFILVHPPYLFKLEYFFIQADEPATMCLEVCVDRAAAPYTVLTTWYV